MATITNAGVGSGLDLEAIISATLQASNQPKLQKFASRESELEVQLTGIGGIKSVMSKLQDVFEELASPEEFNQRVASVRQPSNSAELGDLVSVSSDKTATTGAFEINVLQLAKGSRAQTDATNPANAFNSADEVVTTSAGILTFTAGENSFDIDIEAGSTLEDIRQAINSDSSSGISANIINTGTQTLLVIEAAETGSGNDLVITNNNAELDRLSTVANGGGAGGLEIGAEDQAQDAIIEVDGIQISNTSNVFSNAVQGLTITAERQSETNETANVNVAFDREGVTEKIDEFISAFNNTIDMIGQQSSAVSSPLFGDATVRAIKDQLTNALTTTVGNAGDFETIFDIGLSLNENGKLEKENVVRSLSEALDTNFSDIGKLFTNPGGIADTFGSILENYVDSSGVLKQRQDILNLQKDDLEDDRLDHQFRMEQLESSLRKKYASLDTLIASMRSSGDYLMGQLSSLPGFTRE
ncbi:flagellar filament capping protein FliD [Alteromonas mediterranea]|jgi:flagellar hook-associated protein 2|uniref:Flagellar hook-associated protein 2 n=2 Tax=Pseudomonadati TaxID=3379134 RepID=F2G374_ALTMD|nr:flagellar filament capping protein FliD [Alteromonas mediterranea]AEA97298.1 flagellar hook protein [Alteromonas mediterranea DE]CAH1206330.1 B-type flagellar hook-associated protein 2 [Alteromonas mediterranea]